MPLDALVLHLLHAWPAATFEDLKLLWILPQFISVLRQCLRYYKNWQGKDKLLKQVSSVALGMLHSESRMLKSPNL